ncbi:hypothetical protein BAU15_08250 [Enterococcus sp. JM4C]|uniref:helix-turn-helix domain-containing protein n=1 Tax=Candidatus Enterococcus huntleyi TaxID=1857217 RepID=UPI00137A9C30|nr:helix-turn-helix transcriptional regulator [Enterococcus sp. JM4C]KAF1297886.1 hypothetical protein BAU15_08250 [Enterococcus sp. JM4C]
MNIGAQLQQQRKKLNYTQEEIAEKIHVSRQTISSWENSKSLPDITSVILLSDIYDLSLDNLLKGDRKMIEKIEAEEKLKKANERITRACQGISVIAITMSVIFSFGGSLGLDLQIVISTLAIILALLNLSILTVFNEYRQTVEGTEQKKKTLSPKSRIILAFILALVVISYFVIIFFFVK